MSTELKGAYEFGPFRLDPKNRLLLRDRQAVPLTPKALDTLLLLVERNGRLMTKDDLMKVLWPDTFVNESNLTQTVFMLRKALGETGGDQRYIMTVPGQGYRFAADVKLVSGDVVSAVDAPVSSRSFSASRAVEKSAPRRWLFLLGIAMVLIASLSAYFQWFRPRARHQSSSGRLMLAVLPFENLTGDAGQDYFTDGMTEEMIAQLGRLDPQHLGVIARTSVMHYKHSQEQLEKIGRELGVQYVLEGSVRRDADKVRITAQLIQMKDQTHLWARQYDRELSNLLALQREIAQEIAVGIRLTFDDDKRDEAARRASLSPGSYEAYDLYLKGRYFWNKRTPEGFQRAVEYFQQATENDPNYARAYAGLADSYALMSSYHMVPPREVISKARAAALRAVELDERLAEAHASLAVIAQNYDWDWPTVEKEYRRAIELDPNYPTAHHWYAESLALEGRFDEAFVEIERARQLDPLSLIIATDYGAILYFSRQYDRAIEQFRAVLDMEPNFPRAHMLVEAYVQKGRYAEALADIENWRRIEDNPWSWMMLAYVYGRSGQQVEARRALEELEELNRRRKADALSIAVAHVGMGDKEKAITWLQNAYAEHSISTALKVDPIFDPLRSDPRFQELMRRVGLPP